MGNPLPLQISEDLYEFAGDAPHLDLTEPPPLTAGYRAPPVNELYYVLLVCFEYEVVLSLFLLLTNRLPGNGTQRVPRLILGRKLKSEGIHQLQGGKRALKFAAHSFFYLIEVLIVEDLEHEALLELIAVEGVQMEFIGFPQEGNI